MIIKNSNLLVLFYLFKEETYGKNILLNNKIKICTKLYNQN